MQQSHWSSAVPVYEPFCFPIGNSATCSDEHTLSLALPISLLQMRDWNTIFNMNTWTQVLSSEDRNSLRRYLPSLASMRFGDNSQANKSTSTVTMCDDEEDAIVATFVSQLFATQTHNANTAAAKKRRKEQPTTSRTGMSSLSLSLFGTTPVERFWNALHSMLVRVSVHVRVCVYADMYT